MRFCLPLMISLLTLAASAQKPPIQMEQSNTTASLRGIHAAGPGVAWASGTNGTVLRTEDAGFVWQGCTMPPGAEKLDFRGVWAWDAMNAIVMSSGPGDQSRLYKTTDGCATWKLLLANTDKDGFWDALAFSDSMHGYLLGDPVNGKFQLRQTLDRGDSWSDVTGPEALPGTGAFAASNSSLGLVSRLPEDGWLKSPVFGSGGSSDPSIPSEARLYQLVRNTWRFTRVPLAGANASSGVFSLASRSFKSWVAVGGDYTKPSMTSGTAAFTNDGAEHWKLATKPPHGYRSSVAWDPDHRAWITAGPNGTDFSRDDGRTWVPLENGNWNAISLPYLVGPNGRVGKLISLAVDPSTGPAGQNAHSSKTVNHTGAKTR